MRKYGYRLVGDTIRVGGWIGGMPCRELVVSSLDGV